MFDLLERFFAKFAKRSNNKGFSVIILLFWMNLDKLWTIGPFVGHPTVPPFMFIPNDLLLFSCLLIRMFLITVKGSEWDSKHFHTNHPNVETRDTRHLNLTKPSMSGKYLLPHQATTQSNHTKRPHQATTPSYHTKLPHQEISPNYHTNYLTFDVTLFSAQWIGQIDILLELIATGISKHQSVISWLLILICLILVASKTNAIIFMLLLQVKYFDLGLVRPTSIGPWIPGINETIRWRWWSWIGQILWKIIKEISCK